MSETSAAWASQVGNLRPWEIAAAREEVAHYDADQIQGVVRLLAHIVDQALTSNVTMADIETILRMAADISGIFQAVPGAEQVFEAEAEHSVPWHLLKEALRGADYYSLMESLTPARTSPAKSATPRPTSGAETPLTPSRELAAVVGFGQLSRAEVVARVWAYIKKNKLQSASNEREIISDAKLKPIFGGRERVSSFEMNKHLQFHLGIETSSEAGRRKPQS